MKRVLFILLFTMIALPAYAGLITVKTLSDDASVNDLNQNFNTIKNTINGDIESANIAADTLAESDFADEINPRVRYADHFADYTKTGHLPVTDTDLTSDISAGTSYVEGYRCVTSATEKTYTASKDTWVYIDINSTFQYEEVANSAAQPTEPSNSLLLAKVVTDADNITSVTDHRVTSLSVGNLEDFRISGMEVMSCDQDYMSVDPGVVYVGTTRIEKTTVIELNTGTAADWHDGVKDEYTVAEWCYVGVNTSGSIRLLGNNAPDYHNTSGDSVGTKYYKKIGTAYWRVIAAMSIDTGEIVTAPFKQYGDTVMYSIPQSLTTAVSSAAWTPLSVAGAIPSFSEQGIFGLFVDDNGGTDTAGIWIRPNGTNWSTSPANGIYNVDSGNTPAIAGQRQCFTDSSQIIEYYNNTGDNNTEITVEGYNVSGIR